jgi:hypothetical protein
MILMLLLVTATFRPAAPTVGDPITIEFRETVRLDASPAYEIVSQTGTRAVVRTFQPKEMVLSGQAGNVRFRGLKIPVKSVLKPADELKPAPLKAPVELPASRVPLVAIATASVLGLAAWAAVFALARRRVRTSAPISMMPAADRFKATVLALVDDDRSPNRWAGLADATRAYLATLTPYLGPDLTTTQLLARIDAEHIGTVAEILRRGDAEKFSPWGAPAGDFPSIATRALSLIPVVQEKLAA